MLRLWKENFSLIHFRFTQKNGAEVPQKKVAKEFFDENQEILPRDVA